MIAVVSTLLILASIGIDQLTKYLAVTYVAPVGTIDVIPNFFNLTYVENRGVAFGLFKDMPWLFVVLTGIIMLSLVVITIKLKITNKLYLSAFILIISGGIGNMIDRVVNNYVVDFLSISFFPPVCNFADYCVTVGIVLLLIYLIFFSDFFKDSKKVNNERK